jgi:signal transduction histidine kinase
MKRPSRTWIVFGLSSALLFAAVGWVSLTVLRLESAQWEAAFVADREEKVRLALWRMDSSLAALMVEESARPALAYAPFHSAARAYSRAFTAIPPGDVLVPSPLLGFASSNVLLHFQLGPDGQLTSPQVPVGNERDLAETGYTTGPRIETAAAHLEELRRLLDAPAAATPALAPAAPNPASAPTAPSVARNGELLRRETRLAPAEKPPGPAPPSVPLPFSNRLSPADSLQSQVLLNNFELEARHNFSRQYQQAANVPAPSELPSRSPTPAPSLAPAIPPREGPLRPLWIGDTLLLARGAVLPEGPVVQGCWLDWSALRQTLLASLRDLLPDARLEPLRDPAASREPRALASLPVRLVPGVDAPPAIPFATPVRISLAVACICVLAAAVAVAFLLRGALALGERRGAFVSAVTHELRSPLTTFRMYSEMLAEGMVTDPATRQAYLDTLCAESNRLGHLVENVLAFAGLERGSARRNPETLTVDDLLRRVTPRLLQRSRQADLELAIAPAPPDCLLHVDVSAVEQILFNLVDNACKYAAPTATERVLHLEPAISGRFVVLRLRDHGPGIPAARSRRLFRPFGKSAHEAATSAPGVGLGLALSRRLARSLGGDLVLDTDGKPGAAFSLWLPGRETAPVTLPAHPPAREP